MNTSKNNDINILDLPDEMLLIILSKMDMVDIFYSLVDLNKRFNQLVFDPLYIHHLDLRSKTFKNHNSSVDNQVFDQIRTKVLPRIHYKVNKITVTLPFMEFIFNTVDYPQLHSLSIVNFQQETLLQYLTSDVIFCRVLSDQITHLKVEIKGGIIGKLPKLKCFSLISYFQTYAYDKRIVPLLRRMLNLEELTLLISATRIKLPYIDGNHLYNDFLVQMPRLNKFTFSINTLIDDKDVKIDLPSNDDIQNSFIKIGYQHVDSYANVMKIGGRCHAYSLPYQFDTFLHLTNSFRHDNFYKVRWLVMSDAHSFEHEFFKILSQDFPFLQRLTVYNLEPQKNKQHSSTLITFAEVSELNLAFAHIDYVEEFLLETNIRLPRLTILGVKYESLAMVTNNFTNDAARFNCSQLRHITILEPFVRPENFHSYFPLL
ncbi:unnamed protein product [Rotaria sp. Silwood1]|nr:unnamed protein product [Rotaria sp. Silwood1]CAF1626225.1 unnamed protein product [Rotaria sp. Silwood1]CAF3753741.1 unnamed protein product [Rotaria sp. Silwood1]CAF4978231.1 unnamed protein product [Rotaria sp. Silwood1]CAF5105117.1 unnamed protein product [Rotaria sp. Silwood1]